MEDREDTELELAMTRRDFIVGATATAVALSANAGHSGDASETGPIELPPLPYAENALDPYISSRTLSFHYGKHHRAYIDTTNQLIVGTELAGSPLEKIVATATGDAGRVPLFNAAAQAWNHGFYWKSMRPRGGGSPSGMLAARIDASFGSLKRFKELFTDAATTQFGSGWAWLVAGARELQIVKTSNADTPIAHGQKPLVTIDVWEHAYYLDYQNRRAEYVGAWLDHLVNWDFASENLVQA